MLRRTKDILNATLPSKTERVVPCPTTLYQRDMLNLLTSKDRASAVKGINNVIMECRKVCNEPMLSKLHVAGVDASLKDLCVPASVQLGGKMAVLLQLLRRLRVLGVQSFILTHADLQLVHASVHMSMLWLAWWAAQHGDRQLPELHPSFLLHYVSLLRHLLMCNKRN